MRIIAISVYEVDLPYVDECYSWSGGNSVAVAQTTVVRIETDNDVYGVGEVCPLPGYLPAYGAGVRPGIAEIGPKLMGVDPTCIGHINRLMDVTLKGHAYVKSPIDIACWDILGKVAGLPVHALLGGRQMDRMPMYRVVNIDTPEIMVETVQRYRDQGYRHFQMKVGGDAGEDIERIRAVVGSKHTNEIVFADANTGWRRDDALRVAAATRDLYYYIEQPCELFEDCRSVAPRASQPIKLDEILQSTAAILRAHQDDCMDAASIKIGRFGGLSKARFARDLCGEMGVPVNVEDTWGSDVVTAACAHLAVSTPPELLLNTTDLNNYVTVSVADGAPVVDDGYLKIGDAPGLGVKLKEDVLGEPVAVFS